MKYLKTFESFESDESKYFNIGQDRPEFIHIMNKYNEEGIEAMENHELSSDGLIHKLIALDEGGHGVDSVDFEDIKIELEDRLKKQLTKSDIDKLVGFELRIKDEE